MFFSLKTSDPNKYSACFSEKFNTEILVLLDPTSDLINARFTGRFGTYMLGYCRTSSGVLNLGLLVDFRNSFSFFCLNCLLCFMSKEKGECLLLALKNRCYNLIESVHSNKHFRAKKHSKKCRIHKLPLVHLDGENPLFSNRLRCVSDVEGNQLILILN